MVISLTVCVYLSELKMSVSVELIDKLPPLVIRQLCRYLNTEGSGVHNWKDLLANTPGNHYNAIYDTSAFARAGLRMDSSPAEELLTDLTSLGITVDQLYISLHKMDAIKCMNTLVQYGTYGMLA